MLRLANVQSGRAWVFSTSKEDSTPQGLVFFCLHYPGREEVFIHRGLGEKEKGERGKGGKRKKGGERGTSEHADIEETGRRRRRNLARHSLSACLAGRQYTESGPTFSLFHRANSGPSPFLPLTLLLHVPSIPRLHPISFSLSPIDNTVHKFIIDSATCYRQVHAEYKFRYRFPPPQVQGEVSNGSGDVDKD